VGWCPSQGEEIVSKPERHAVQVKNAPPALGNYSHAIAAGRLLFVAGQGCRSPQSGEEVGVELDDQGNVLKYDIEAQTRGVIENLRTVLHASGLKLENVVDITVFLADMKDFNRYNSVYSEYFSFPEPPARTTVQVAGLPGKNFIEIKAIAMLPEPSEGEN